MNGKHVWRDRTWRPSIAGGIASVVFLLVPPLATAAIRTVTNLADDGPGSLRSTIALAASGDTIEFAVTGTIVLTTGSLNNLSEDLAIVGPGSPDKLILTRDTNGAPFRILLLPDGSVTLPGLTITRGNAVGIFSGESDGGGIYVSSGTTLTLDNCVIVDNVAASSPAQRQVHAGAKKAISYQLFPLTSGAGAVECGLWSAEHGHLGPQVSPKESMAQRS